MTIHEALKPWRDDPAAPDYVHQLLRAADDQGPSAAQLERLAARTAAGLGLAASALSGAALPQGPAPADLSPAMPSLAPAAPGAAASSALTWKVAAVLCSLGLGGLWWATQAAPRASGPEQAPERAAPAFEPAPAIAPVESDSAPALDPAAPTLEPEAAPQEAKPAARAARSKVAPAPAEAAPDELTLIKQAQGLRADPRAMLDVLGRHARLYPNGMLEQEREVLTIEALVNLGRARAARARAAQLEARHPQSAHLPKVRALLEKAPE